MIHLLPLPGSPAYSGSMSQVVDTALADAAILVDAGFPALMIENFGDAPFYPSAVLPETVAAMTAAIARIGEATEVPLGVNVLRNDAMSALGIAAATGADLIRVNVLTGMMYTDQGPIVGMAADVVRKRAFLCPNVEIWADVMVKHATPPPGSDAGQSARDTVERGGADAIIVSGAGTGTMLDLDQASVIRSAVPKGTRLVVGSGATPDNLAALTELADSVIVGSSVKFDGDASSRVDPVRARAMVVVARDCGLTS
jgi:membrane complex biogenesis BtpA family protein